MRCQKREEKRGIKTRETCLGERRDQEIVVEVDAKGGMFNV